MNTQLATDVLVIDNNVEAVASMATIISMYGFSVEAFYTGQSAIEAIQQLRPRLIITDVELDGMSGYDVLEAVFAIDPVYRPVTASISAWDNAEARFRKGERKFDFDFKKPVTLEVILSMLDLIKT